VSRGPVIALKMRQAAAAIVAAMSDLGLDEQDRII